MRILKVVTSKMTIVKVVRINISIFTTNMKMMKKDNTDMNVVKVVMINKVIHRLLIEAS